MTDDKDINFDFDDVMIRQWAKQIHKIKTIELQRSVQAKELIVKGSSINTTLIQYDEDYGVNVDELCNLKEKLRILETSDLIFK